MQFKKQQLEPDMEKCTSSKLEKEYVKSVSPFLFNLYVEYIVRNAGLKEAQAGIKIAGRNPTSGHTHRGNQIWKRHVHPNVHRSTVYNSQDMEAT